MNAQVLRCLEEPEHTPFRIEDGPEMGGAFFPRELVFADPKVARVVCEDGGEGGEGLRDRDGAEDPANLFQQFVRNVGGVTRCDFPVDEELLVGVGRDPGNNVRAERCVRAYRPPETPGSRTGCSGWQR